VSAHSLRHRVLAAVLVAAAGFAAAAGPLAAQARPRIAVIGFENNTTSRLFGDRLGEAAADELTTQLVRTNAFSVIERRAIQSLLDEQALGRSGAVDASTAARLGRLLGAQFVLLGSITQFSIEQRSAGVGRIGVAASYSQAESALDVRVVDVGTGEIRTVAEGKGTRRFGGAQYRDINLQRQFDAGIAQEALRPAVEDAIEQILKQREAMAAAPAAPFASVVGLRDADIYIDRGENAGLRAGQRLAVFRVVDRIRDAQGNVLDEVTDEVGELEVVRVLSQSAIARVVRGEVKEGDRVGAKD
jgi:curli biogenesis system outer membrane secretion channel CsgG